MISKNVISLQKKNSSGESFQLLNRDNLPIFGTLRTTGPLENRLVIVVHGLGGSSRQAQIQEAAATFADYRCNVLTYDATNSFGNSGGNLKYASLTRHANDLEDVISWCRKELKFDGKVIVCGFSMGASAAFVVQSRNRKLINSIIAFAPIVSGEIWLHNFRISKPGSYERLQAIGSFVKFDEVTNNEGEIGQYFVDDVLKYDFLKDEILINVPTYLAGGDLDTTCPPEALHALKANLKSTGRLKIIRGLPHTARKPQETKLIREFLSSLIHKSKDGIWPQAEKKTASAR
ncbi:alpha/beta hydrolase [Labrenzia sp. R5_0]|jgi:pimeloyl-ACP methyl ester carboxylesterase|uniref:alpha/beta hydrolase n=1 Tax=Labrenzia sp. R5_0 TaxID=2821108 RepID=UPI001ADA6A76|nr:alpha/beta hydrolase [Labrenzia sp. R5_0]MBO9459217.1 alpha/beta hydrolase [Labrenzia sp. R5_0]